MLKEMLQVFVVTLKLSIKDVTFESPSFVILIMINQNHLGPHGWTSQSTCYHSAQFSVKICLLLLCRSLASFRNFVDPIKARGGGDTPEDIMGALKVALSALSWRSSSAKVKVLYTMENNFITTLCCRY